MAEYSVILGLVTVTALVAYQLLGGPIAALIGDVVSAFPH
jgi:Flp pilus assembly pilin Flp